LYPIVFNHEGTANNRWISYGGDTGLLSSESPAIIPFRSKMAATVFTNRKTGADLDIEVYSVAEGSGVSAKTLDFTWDLNNCRYARKTNFSSDIIFEAGDRLSVYFRDRGTNPADAHFTIYLEILADNSEEVCDNTSGNVSFGGNGDDDDDDDD
jgi:hypothetical protein